MAYKRPLTRRQSALIVVLWIFFVVLYLRYAPFNLMTLVVLALSGVFVLYPIRKSLRERQEYKSSK